MIDFSLVAIIVLVVLLIAFWRYAIGRFRTLEQKIADLTVVKEDLQRLLVQDDTLMDKKTADGQPEEKTAEKTASPLVAVGARHPAVVKKQPPVVVKTEQKEETPAKAAAEEDEVVAVIMAAIAAYGYSPAAVRSIRPHQAKSRDQRSKWALAARLGSMNR